MGNKAFIIIGDGEPLPIVDIVLSKDRDTSASTMGSMSFPREISGEMTIKELDADSVSLLTDGSLGLRGRGTVEPSPPREIDTSEDMASYEIYVPERPSELPRNRQNSFGSFLNKGKRW
ncbi:hypothetical protein C0431_13060 [bacterium]|nr:hypothetical protein [bacterium]